MRLLIEIYRKAMMGAVFILLCGSIAEICAVDWRSWLGAAVLIRLGVGLAQSILITYVSELTPFQIRGFMIGAYQLFIGVGQLISAVATQLVITTQPNRWRPLIATEFVFTGILILLIWFVPESHLYYARKGDHENAKKSMLRLYDTAPGYDVVSLPHNNITELAANHLLQEYEYRVVQHGIEAERAFSEASKESSFLEIFKGLNWRRTLAGCIGICSQWTAGAPIVFGYSTVNSSFSLSVLPELMLAVLLQSRWSQRPIYRHNHHFRLAHRVNLLVVDSLRIHWPSTSPYWVSREQVNSFFMANSAR
jgi:MFS transporter, SP family, general alpha glucoside:H+ symporter